MTTAIGIGDSLVRRLRDHSVRHVFGVPGDFTDFVNGLGAVGLPRRDRAVAAPRPLSLATSTDASTSTLITAEALFRCLPASLTDETVVIADPGDALFGATDFPVHPAAALLSPAFYASLGFAVPARFKRPGSSGRPPSGSISIRSSSSSTTEAT